MAVGYLAKIWQTKFMTLVRRLNETIFFFCADGAAMITRALSWTSDILKISSMAQSGFLSSISTGKMVSLR